MYLCREFDSKGICKYFCTSCHSIFLESCCKPPASGINAPGIDRMYKAAKDLLSVDAVKVFLSVTDDTFEHFLKDYEDDNDYERYGILHRHSYDYHIEIENGKFFRSAVFERGPNYFKYIHSIFPEGITHCPYCGSKQLRYSSFSCRDADFFTISAVKQSYSDAAKSFTQKIIKQFQSEQILLPSAQKEVDHTKTIEFLRHLVDVHANIEYLQRRLLQIYPIYLEYSATLKGKILQAHFPASVEISPLPPEPEYKQLTLFGSKKIGRENQQRRENHLSSPEYAANLSSHSRYDETRSSFAESHSQLIADIDNSIADFSIGQYSTEEPVLTSKVAAFAQEIRSCCELLQAQIHTRRKLYATEILYRNYRGFDIESTLLEYLESGRCNTFTGYDGAYNKYDNELNQKLIIKGMDKIIHSLQQIQENQYLLYCALNEMNCRLSDMSNHTEQILAAANQTAASAKIEAYNSSQALYFSKIAAESTAVSAFFDFYDHL